MKWSSEFLKYIALKNIKIARNPLFHMKELAKQIANLKQVFLLKLIINFWLDNIFLSWSR